MAMVQTPPKLNQAALDLRAKTAKRIQEMDDLHYHRQGRKRLFRHSMIAEAYKLGALGLRMPEIARFWNVSPRTLDLWSKRYPDFEAEIDRGRQEADVTVIKALLDQARAGNMTACIFWLKNRHPENWRDRRELEVDGEIRGSHPITQIIFEADSHPQDTTDAERDLSENSSPSRIML